MLTIPAAKLTVPDVAGCFYTKATNRIKTRRPQTREKRVTYEAEM